MEFEWISKDVATDIHIMDVIHVCQTMFYNVTMDVLDSKRFKVLQKAGLSQQIATQQNTINQCV